MDNYKILRNKIQEYSFLLRQQASKIKQDFEGRDIPEALLAIMQTKERVANDLHDINQTIY